VKPINETLEAEHDSIKYILRRFYGGIPEDVHKTTMSDENELSYMNEVESEYSASFTKHQKHALVLLQLDRLRLIERLQNLHFLTQMFVLARLMSSQRRLLKHLNANMFTISIEERNSTYSKSLRNDQNPSISTDLKRLRQSSLLIKQECHHLAARFSFLAELITGRLDCKLFTHNDCGILEPF
jgi:hypothetical protein